MTLPPEFIQLSSLPSPEQQLDLLHRNLRPQIQALVRRTQFNCEEGLLDLALEAEQTLEYYKTYQPPLPVKAALLPEMAYKPTLAERQLTPKVSAVQHDLEQEPETESESESDDLAAALARIAQQLEVLLNNQGAPRLEQNWRKGGQRSRYSRFYRHRKKSTSPKREDSSGKKSPAEPKNNTSPESRQKTREPIACCSCGKLGYTRSFCPDCSED